MQFSQAVEKLYGLRQKNTKGGKKPTENGDTAAADSKEEADVRACSHTAFVLNL